MNYYGLRNKRTGRPVGFSIISEVGEFGGDYFVELLDDSDYIWLVRSREIAERAIQVNTPWYNAGYETPSWSVKNWDTSGYEVFEVTI